MTDSAIRLNIGSGDLRLPGFTPVDARFGHDALRLSYLDNAVDEVYASHVLEHISHTQTISALKEWYRVLKPGGRIRVSVSDIAQTIARYNAGDYTKFQELIAGNQQSPHDYHISHFDERKLRYVLDEAGFVGLETFAPIYNDGTKSGLSLNFEAYKPKTPDAVVNRKILACMSAPRLLFLDQVNTVMMVLTQMGIPIATHTGSNWGQCLERCFEQAVEQGYEWIMGLDYDSVASEEQIARLITLFDCHPEYDALAPMQVKRECGDPLFWNRYQDDIDPVNPIFPCETAHFGCTLIRVEALKKMAHPWFLHVPNAEGRWGPGKTDDDIYFWNKFRECGNSLGCTPRVHIGHLQLMVSWYKWGGDPVHQYVSDYRKFGKPADI